jgi:hypothetical protein
VTRAGSSALFGAAAVERPIFIVGTGRSGTTLLLDLLAFHSDLAWFSNYDERFPALGLGILARVHNLPFTQLLLERHSRYVPRPIESYRMLDRCTNGLFTQRRNLTESDATCETRERFHAVVRRQLRLQGKPRFVTKYTGLPRLSFVKEVFRDALFLHVYRDGRAVTNSLLRVDWWAGDESSWRYGEMPEEYRQEYEQSGRNPVVLAGIVWKTLMDAIEGECSCLPSGSVLRVRYDEMVRDAPAVMRRVADFCGLSWSPDFVRHVRSERISDMDTKWTRQLTQSDQELLQKVIGPALGKYGFA